MIVQLNFRSAPGPSERPSWSFCEGAWRVLSKHTLWGSVAEGSSMGAIRQRSCHSWENKPERGGSASGGSGAHPRWRREAPAAPSPGLLLKSQAHRRAEPDRLREANDSTTPFQDRTRPVPSNALLILSLALEAAPRRSCCLTHHLFTCSLWGSAIL